MDRSSQDFIDYVKADCVAHGVKFKEYKRSYIKLTDSIKCSGFFSSGEEDQFKEPILAYAAGRADYLEVLTHEYCHMTQWLDGIQLWADSIESMECIDKWLAGEKVRNIGKHISISRDLELDNEKRTVKMIKKWGLPIDIGEYTKKANAYVHFYNYLKISRKWSVPPNTPYSNPRVLKKMSTRFNMDYETLSPELKKIFVEEKI